MSQKSTNFFGLAVCNDLRFGLVENCWERHVTSFVTTTAFSNVCDEFCIAIQGSIKISLFLLGIYSINLNLDMDKMYLWDRQSKKIMERLTEAYGRVVKKVVTFHQFLLLQMTLLRLDKKSGKYRRYNTTNCFILSRLVT